MRETCALVSEPKKGSCLGIRWGSSEEGKKFDQKTPCGVYIGDVIETRAPEPKKKKKKKEKKDKHTPNHNHTKQQKKKTTQQKITKARR